MLKVFLVEDEVVVREGIKNNIDWAGNGYEFCGEASDGELAFPMIQKCKPDILITDIKMPFMDGLTLSKLVKKEMPWTEIIILTGYEEFEYAKEGIHIGVAKYLSKPISGSELLKEVDALATIIYDKQKEREIRDKYTREMEENIEREKTELCHLLVTGGKSAAEIHERARKIDIELSAIWYNILIIKARSTQKAQGEYSGSIIKVNEEIKDYIEQEGIIEFEGNLDEKIIIIKADTKEELEQKLDRLIVKMKSVYIEHENIRYFGGVGEAVNRLTELPEAYVKANQAMAQQYLVSESRIMHYYELKSGVTQEEFNIRSIDPEQVDSSKVREFLKVASQDEVEYFVEAFFGGFETTAMNSKMFLQYITMDIYFSVIDFVESMQRKRDEIEAIDPYSKAFETIENAKVYVQKIIKQAIGIRNEIANDRYGDVVNDVMRYIEEHYSEEDLSLNTLATSVNFSPNHLSAVFSQKTGRTIIKYLTDYRMNKAKELLRCTGKRSSIISTEVGYKDPHYFSYLFKKTQGMTPTQYREGTVVEGEE